MNKTFFSFHAFPPAFFKAKRIYRLLSLFFALLFGCLLFSSCKAQTDYFSRVSENRSNIFLCGTENFSLKIYAATRENPYVADGVPREPVPKTEVFLTAAETTEAPVIALAVNGREYGGDMSFDNAKTVYYYSCTLDSSECVSIPVRVTYKGTTVETNAVSVKTETTLSPRAALETVLKSESEKINSMTDKNGFAGEFYIRLICEDELYYYVGIVDRNGKILSLLLNAESGKILAKRESRTA